jgi:hypothetical protein
MKKTLLFLITLLFVTEFSFGQLTIGLRAGYNGNKLATSLSSIKSQFRSGFHVGVFSRFGKRLYFAPELIYTFSGGKFSNEGAPQDSTWNQKVSIGSMDIPLLLGFKIINSMFLKWRVELGPVASFVVNKKITNVNDFTGPIKNADINTANWLIMVGTGIDVLFFTLDIRYEYAFNSLIKNVNNYSFNSHNNFVIVSLGFKFIGNK